ncbi:MAG: tyrosine-type recombinase/integrase [Promethearchaeia archaeon]
MENIRIITKKDNKKYSVRENRNRIFTPKEWKKFYDACSVKQKFTFKVLLLTGARIMEVRNIKVGDFDFPNQRVVLRVTKGKKSNVRTLRISKELCRDIKRKIKENELLSDNYIGILSTPAANIALKKTLKKIKIRDWQMFSVHNIRKTSENWALAIGIDSMILSKRFGHNLMTAYKHYTQSDAFTYSEKDDIRIIYGDTFI